MQKSRGNSKASPTGQWWNYGNLIAFVCFSRFSVFSMLFLTESKAHLPATFCKDKYTWTQTLNALEVFVHVPPGQLMWFVRGMCYTCQADPSSICTPCSPDNSTHFQLNCARIAVSRSLCHMNCSSVCGCSCMPHFCSSLFHLVPFHLEKASGFVLKNPLPNPSQGWRPSRLFAILVETLWSWASLPSKNRVKLLFHVVERCWNDSTVKIVQSHALSVWSQALMQMCREKHQVSKESLWFWTARCIPKSSASDGLKVTSRYESNIVKSPHHEVVLMQLSRSMQSFAKSIFNELWIRFIAIFSIWPLHTFAISCHVIDHSFLAKCVKLDVSALITGEAWRLHVDLDWQ